jgi:hypothetical protein
MGFREHESRRALRHRYGADTLELYVYRTQEAVAELSAYTDDPPACLLCDAPTPMPAMIGYLRGGRDNDTVTAIAVCEPCVQAATDLRATVYDALCVWEGEDTPKR